MAYVCDNCGNVIGSGPNHCHCHSTPDQWSEAEDAEQFVPTRRPNSDPWDLITGHVKKQIRSIPGIRHGADGMEQIRALMNEYQQEVGDVGAGTGFARWAMRRVRNIRED